MSRLRGSLNAILNNEKKDSTYYRIAHYLAENVYHLKRISIQDISNHCFVSKSTVSRFCRDIGYEDYYELNHDMYQLVETHFNKFQRYNQDSYGERQANYYKDLLNGIEHAKKYIRQEDVDYLASMLLRYHNIGILGSLHSHAVSEYFQHDLGLFSKVISAPLLPENQQDFIINSDQNTLIIVVSCKGNYFNQLINKIKLTDDCYPHCILITNNSKMKDSNLYEKIIYIPCNENYAQQPRNIGYFLNLVVLEYAYLYQKIDQ